MQRFFLQTAFNNNQLALTPTFINALHPAALKNFGIDQKSVAIVLAEKGDINGMEVALKRDPQLLTLASSIDVTPLIAATLKNQVEMVKFLLKKGCQFATPAHQQAYLRSANRDNALCKKSIEMPDAAGLVPLDYAVASGDMNEVQLWLQDIQDQNIEINFYKLLQIAILNGHTHLFPILVPQVGVDLLINKAESFSDCFLEATSKTGELLAEVLKYINVESKMMIAAHVILYLACKGELKATLSQFLAIKNAESKDTREVLWGHLLGCIIKYVRKHSSSENTQQRVLPAIDILVKAFAQEYAAKPLIAQYGFLMFINQDYEECAFYFLNQLPKDVISSIINKKIDNVPLLHKIIEKSSLSYLAFYNMLYLGADLKIKNDNDESIDMLLEKNSAWQQNIKWKTMHLWQPYLYNVFDLNKLIIDFFTNKKFNQAEFKEKINYMKDLKKCAGEITLEDQQRLVNECLNNFWRLFRENVNPNTKKSFLENAYFIVQSLMPDDFPRVEDYVFHQRAWVKLAYVLGKTEQALEGIQKIEKRLTHRKFEDTVKFTPLQSLDHFLSRIKNSKEPIPLLVKRKGDIDPLDLLPIYYSKLVLTIVTALKLKPHSASNFLLCNITAAQSSGLLIGDDALCNETLKIYALEDFTRINEAMKNFLFLQKNYEKADKERLQKSEVTHVLLAIIQSIYQLNILLNCIEEKLLKSLLSGSTDINKLKLTKNNKKSIETLKEFYQCRVKINEYLNKISAVQRDFLSHADLPELNINYVEQYAPDIKRMDARLLVIDSILFNENELAPAKKVKSDNKKPPKPTAKKVETEEDDDVIEEVFIPGQSGLPRYYPNVERPLVQTSLPFPCVAPPKIISSANKPTAPASKPGFFSTTKPAPESPIDKKVRALMQLGYNHRFPKDFLYFLAKFEPGEVYVVGSGVNYAIGDMNKLPQDWDAMVDLTEEEFKKRLTGANDVHGFKRDGFGKEYSYKLRFKHTTESKPLKIDATFLTEPGATKEERLAANSIKRDISANSLIYDPFAPKEKQIYDFHNGRAASKQTLIVPLPRKLPNCYEAEPKLILRTLVRLCQGWHLSVDDEIRFSNSVKYLEQLASSTIQTYIIKIYKDIGVKKAELVFIKYKIYDVVNVKVVIEEVKKHPEWYEEEEAASAPTDTTFVTEQRELKLSI